MGSVVAIIQARMASTRLPGKVLKEIAGRPMLWHVVTRARRAATLDEVVVATTTAAADDILVDFCRQHDIPVFRGSEHDVLDRYYQTAKHLSVAVIVRITADCPLLDPGVIDEVVSHFFTDSYDYVSNVDPPTFPDGLDTEVFSAAALELTWQQAEWQSEREHVTPYLRSHPEIFRLGNVVNDEDLSGLRWTVDEEEDLRLAGAVYHALGHNEFSMKDVLELLARRPNLREVNAGIGRNEGLAKSRREDRLV